MKLVQLLHDAEGVVDSENTTVFDDVEVRRVVADSRRVEPGDLFVAVRGTLLDGHDKIGEAVEKGARAIVAEHTHSVARDVQVPIVFVKNSRTAHADLLRAHNPEVREALGALTFVGITGTNGKTTVATVLYQCLQALEVPCGLIGTTGYVFGDTTLPATHTTPDVEKLYDVILQMYRSGVSHVVMEVSSHALAQDRVRGVEFDGAVFTNLTRDHLDYHNTMEEYATEKQKLFRSLAPSSIAVFNALDPYTEFMSTGCKASTQLFIGTQPTLEVLATSVKGSQFVLAENKYSTPLIGNFNVGNVASAAALLECLGFEPHRVQLCIAAATGAAGRMERVVLPSGAVAIVDFAHTPDALRNVLQTCRGLLPGKNKLAVVFGCGGDRDAGKRPQMGATAAELADEVWVTSDNPRTEDPKKIADEIVGGIHNAKASVKVELDRAAAIVQALETANPDDIIVIAGKGHESVQIVGTQHLPFNDRAVVEHYCQRQ